MDPWAQEQMNKHPDAEVIPRSGGCSNVQIFEGKLWGTKPSNIGMYGANKEGIMEIQPSTDRNLQGFSQ